MFSFLHINQFECCRYGNVITKESDPNVFTINKYESSKATILSIEITCWPLKQLRWRKVDVLCLNDVVNYAN